MKFEIELTEDELYFFYRVITAYVANEALSEETNLGKSGELFPKIFHAFGPSLTNQQKARILSEVIMKSFNTGKSLEEIEKAVSVLEFT